MADLRIPPSSLPVARPQAGARVEAANAAQRAFFQAALGDTTPAARPAPAAAVMPSADAPQPQPQRPMRPGSLLDIKV